MKLKLQDKIGGFYSFALDMLLPDDFLHDDRPYRSTTVVGLITNAEGDFVRCNDGKLYSYYNALKMRAVYLSREGQGNQ